MCQTEKSSALLCVFQPLSHPCWTLISWNLGWWSLHTYTVHVLRVPEVTKTISYLQPHSNYSIVITLPSASEARLQDSSESRRDMLFLFKAHTLDIRDINMAWTVDTVICWCAFLPISRYICSPPNEHCIGIDHWLVTCALSLENSIHCSYRSWKVMTSKLEVKDPLAVRRRHSVYTRY